MTWKLLLIIVVLSLKTQNCFLNEAPLLLNPKPSPRQFLVEFFYMFSRRIKIAHIQIVLALNGLTEILATTFFC